VYAPAAGIKLRPPFIITMYAHTGTQFRIAYERRSPSDVNFGYSSHGAHLLMRLPLFVHERAGVSAVAASTAIIGHAEIELQCL
jgi:hypothetical protein